MSESVLISELLSQYYEAPAEVKRNSLPVFGGHRRVFVPGKRSGALPNLGVYRRPSVSDYMKLAALEMELENAAAAEGNFVEIRKQYHIKQIYNQNLSTMTTLGTSKLSPL